MDTQHTPGPWKVSHDEYAGHYHVSTFDTQSGSESIAQVFYTNSKPGGRGEVDARLIAASPELLDLAYQYLSDLRYPPTGDSLQRRIERAEAVIAKATGK